MRSNMFANLENKFEFAGKEVIEATAVQSLAELVEELRETFNTEAIFGIMIVMARLGVAGDGVLNQAEKDLIDEVFGRMYKGSMDEIYNAIGTTIPDSDYEMIGMIAKMGNQIAMPLLHCILSFAYIDQVMEDHVAEKLDSLFGMNLMMEFFNSDLEEVPRPKIRLTGQEAEIVEWFKSDDQLRSLADIQKRFPNKSRAELKRTLDGLCQKGILYGGDQFIGCMYGLESTDAEYYVAPTPARKAESGKRGTQESAQERARKEKEAREKAEAERIRREKEAAERAEAERIRKEKEAAEKAEAERIRKEKEAAENRRLQEEAKAFAPQAERLRARCALASGMIAVSMYHAVAVRSDGTVVAKGRNDHGQCNVSGWKNVVAVACDADGTVGVTSGGRVLYTGDNYHKQADCTAWYGIKAVAMGDNCVFGLKQDGTVVATTEGRNGAKFSSAPDVDTWRNIVAIRANWPSAIIGINNDGRVITMDRNYYGKCQYFYVLKDKDAVDYHPGIFLNKNGSCRLQYNQESPAEINKHKNILSAYVYTLPMALLADGRVVVEPDKENPKNNELERFIEKYRLNNVVGIADGHGMLFLTNDGRIFGFHTKNEYGLKDGELFGSGFRLFDDFQKLMDEKEAEAERIRREKEEKERKLAEEETLRAERRSNNLCQHCGGEFKKVLFGMKCTACGEKKDYK